MLAIGLLKVVLLAASMLIASRWGILAIAWATVFSAFVSLLLNTACSRILISYGIVAQIRDLGAYLLLTLGMLLVVVASAHAMDWLSPGKRLLAEVAIGVAFYLGMASLLRLPAMRFAMEVMASLRTGGKEVAAPRTRHAGD